MQTLIIAAIIYIIVLPIAFRLIGVADSKLKAKKLEKMSAKRGRAGASKDQPTPAWPRWSERIRFTLKDKRQFVFKKPKKGEEPKDTKLQRRGFFWILYTSGLALALVGGLMSNWTLILCSIPVFFIAIIYGVQSADELIKTREKVYKRMFAIAQTKLGQSGEYKDNPQAIIRIIDWADYVKPQKVEFDIPDTFGEDGAEGFLKQYNQIFGTETAWVPSDDPETHEPGWNFEKGIVTIHAVPPLPMRAMWDESYVLDESIAWSFFPLALGVENGVEKVNPKTGQKENILGFDLSGEQVKVSQKFGLKMASKITVSPMALIAGGTGGGKSLASKTRVKTIDIAMD